MMDKESIFSFILVDEVGYLLAVSPIPFEGDGENIKPVKLPNDFSMDNMNCYRYKDGVVVLDREKMSRQQRTMFVKCDGDGYIYVVASTPIVGGMEKAVVLPEDFDYTVQDCYTCIDDVITMDEVKYQQRKEEIRHAQSNAVLEKQMQQDTASVAGIVFAAMAQEGKFDDATISLHAIQFPKWNKADWRKYKEGSICSYGDTLWRFNLPALADESQNLEPGTSETLWKLIDYKNGVRVIPFPRRALDNSEAFDADELGWWEGDDKAKRGVWKAPADSTVWPPETQGVKWTFVREEP